MNCFWVFCLTPAPSPPEHEIFGFGEFIGAIALLIVYFQIVDIRYKFRLAILPSYFRATLLILITFVGLGILAMELWLSQRWVTLYAPISPSVWEAIFAVLFLGTFVALTYAIFIKPPIFRNRNALRYAKAVYRVIVKGDDAELSVVADELSRSSKSLITMCATPQVREKEADTPSTIAYDVLVMIANRKLCRHIVASAQSTAIALCDDAAKLERFDIPIGPFSKVITEEAITNKDSILHQETQQFASDLVGHIKPWSKTMYGDYRLLKNMGFDSPLNLQVWNLNGVWDIDHWRAYTKVVLAALTGFVNTQYRDDGRQLGLAIESIKYLNSELRQIDASSGFHKSNAYERLNLVTDFFEKAIEAIDSAAVPIAGSKKSRQLYGGDVYQSLAELMYETLLAAADVKGPKMTMWMVQHNMAWTSVFERLGKKKGRSLSIVQSRVVRLLYEQIERMEEIGPNYVGIKVVGLVLNIIGLKKTSRNHNLPCERAIYLFAERWAKQNYLQLVEDYPDVADAMLVGSLSYSRKKRKIRKTYAGWLGKKGSRQYLELNEPDEASKKK